MSSYCENGCCKYEMKIYDRCVFTPRNKQKAGVFIYDSIGGKILLVQSRGNLWGPPKGSCEAGETYKECALREVTEETGIRLGTHEINDNNKFIFNNSHYFYCEMEQVSVTLETPMLSNGSNDASGIGWFRLDCLKKLVNSNIININFHCKLMIEYFLKHKF
jgi:8-oxo-dGTP pyrophosphatase MutT (NUDIX family)